MSEYTPYNSILLFHGLGTGKTCSSIQVAEDTRRYLMQMSINKKIIIVASPVVQENYKLQLFDERKLKKVGGKWDLKTCTGNTIIKEVNPIDSDMSRERLVKLIKKKMRSGYDFMGYNKFSNYINNITSKFGIKDSDNEAERKKKAKLIKREFSNRLIIIDEVQNIRNVKDGDKIKESSNNFLKLVKYADNLKLILLTATPMFNDPQEIVWLLNLMNLNDSRVPLNVSDVFDKNGDLLIGNDFQEIGKELLIRKLRGYISYVKGNSPFTFPNAIYPSYYDDSHSIKILKSKGWQYPKIQMNDREIEDEINYLDLTIVPIKEYQKRGYNYVLDNIKRRNPILKEKRKGIQYTLIDGLSQSLNFIYPSNDFDSGDIEYRELYGKQGLSRIMNTTNSMSKNFEYDEDIKEKYGKIFTKNEIGKYSSKISKIINTINNSEGITIIYSQYIYGGCVPIALALEELGMKRYGRDSLFKESPSENIDAITMMPKSEYIELKNNRKFIAAKYAMITGDARFSPNNKRELKAATDIKNINGEIIKVIIISKAGSEGLDFKNVRQVHILDPWYNLNRTGQTVGRAIRNLSHCNLPFVKRNTQIFLYATHLGGENDYDVQEESIDLYMYRNAENKGIKIGKVLRILKENAIDCKLNYDQTHLFEKYINKTVKQELSTGDIIENYKIGDKDYSIECDFMDCNFDPNIKETKDNTLDTSTYNDYYLNNNIQTIMTKIKDLFRKKYLYTKDEIIKEINYSKNYPILQINSALNTLINDKNEKLVDLIGRNGHMKNVNDLYIFNPEELNEEIKLTQFKTRHPINVRPEKIIVNLDNNIDMIRDNFAQIENVTINPQQFLKKFIETYEEIIDTDLHENSTKLNTLFCSFLFYIDDLVNINIIKQVIVDHLIENLSYEEYKILVHHTINFTGESKQETTNSELIEFVKNYLEKFSIVDKDNKLYIYKVFDKSKNKTKINNNIKLFNEQLEEVDIKSKLENLIRKKFMIKDKNSINNIFGFKLKSKMISIFKIKNWKTGKKIKQDKSVRLTAINQIN